MWDLKLNNVCNHRIINEPLEIKGSYPAYYAILKRPVYGNNLEVKIVDEDNLFPVSQNIPGEYTFIYSNVINTYTFIKDYELNNIVVKATVNGKIIILQSNVDYLISFNSNIYAITFLSNSLNRPDNGSQVILQYTYYNIKQNFITYTLGNDKQTLVLNTSTVQVDVREDVYPKHSYYATYYTNQINCPKCIYGTNKTNDIYISVLGRPIITAGFELMIQKVKKIIITALKSNLFDQNYGSELPNLIGKPKTVLTLLRAQNTIQEAIDYIKTEQMRNYELLTDEEKVIKIDNFQVLPTNDPKTLKFSFELYNLAGKNVNIGVSI